MAIVSEKYLIMVSLNNNNKFYKMIPSEDGKTFTAIFGRVGTSGQKKIYNIKDFDKIYQTRLSHGYIDQTAIMSVSDTDGDNELKEIDNPSVKYIVDRLMGLAKHTIKTNYRLSSGQVTEEMIDEAEELLAKMAMETDHLVFNKLLIKLFETIPRKMTNVIAFTARTDEDIPKILQRESDLLDVMKGQVMISKNQLSQGAPKQGYTLLDTLGLEIRDCTDAELQEIKSHLDPDTRRIFHKAWAVKNSKTDAAFESYCKERNIQKCKFYYHGSRSENWWSIINNGLKLNPTNVVISGKAFGYGIYFAPKARKSYGYTSGRGSYWANGTSSYGYMAIYKVAYGKPYETKSNSGCSSFTEKDIIAKGCNCLHAKAGSYLINDEVIVYNENAATIRYLIELSA